MVFLLHVFVNAPTSTTAKTFKLKNDNFKLYKVLRYFICSIRSHLLMKRMVLYFRDAINRSFDGFSLLIQIKAYDSFSLFISFNSSPSIIEPLVARTLEFIGF